MPARTKTTLLSIAGVLVILGLVAGAVFVGNAMVSEPDTVGINEQASSDLGSSETYTPAVGESPGAREAAPYDYYPTQAEPTTVELAPGQLPGNGTFLVGTDIEPGTYRTPGPDGSRVGCTWDRLSGLSGTDADVIVFDGGTGPLIVTVSESDIAFTTAGCQPWALVE